MTHVVNPSELLHFVDLVNSVVTDIKKNEVLKFVIRDAKSIGKFPFARWEGFFEEFQELDPDPDWRDTISYFPIEVPLESFHDYVGAVLNLAPPVIPVLKIVEDAVTNAHNSITIYKNDISDEQVRREVIKVIDRDRVRSSIDEVWKRSDQGFTCAEIIRQIGEGGNAEEYIQSLFRIRTHAQKIKTTDNERSTYFHTIDPKFFPGERSLQETSHRGSHRSKNGDQDDEVFLRDFLSKTAKGGQVAHLLPHSATYVIQYAFLLYFLFNRPSAHGMRKNVQKHKDDLWTLRECKRLLNGYRTKPTNKARRNHTGVKHLILNKIRLVVDSIKNKNTNRLIVYSIE